MRGVEAGEGRGDAESAGVEPEGESGAGTPDTAAQGLRSRVQLSGVG